MLGCGPGGSCCGQCAGMAGALDLSQEYPRTFNVIKRYVDSKVANGEDFFLTDQVNSATVTPDQLGFLTAIIGAISAIAGSVGTVAGAAASIKALKAGKGSSSDVDSVAAQITPLVQQKLAAQGISLPGEIAQQATAAGILDTFGTENKPIVIAGLGLIGVVVLSKLLRR